MSVLLFFVSFCLLLLLLLFLSCYSLLCYSYSFVIEFWSKIHYLSSFFFRVFFFSHFHFCIFCIFRFLFFCLSVAFPLALFVYLFVLFVPIFPLILLLVSSIKNISGAPGHPGPKGEPGESISLHRLLSLRTRLPRSTARLLAIQGLGYPGVKQVAQVS